MNTGSTVGADRQRLAVCLVVAAALHVALLLNVDIPEPRLPHPMPAIEVVLRQEPFSAARGGDTDVETASTDDVPVPGKEEATRQTSPPLEPRALEPRPAPSEAEPVAEPSAGEREGPAPRKKETRPSVLTDTTPHDLARAITAQAAPAPHLDATATGESPRVRRLTGPPSGDPELAYYLDSWRRKVERVGNINYPSEARARGLSGTLRLLVVIDPDGALQDVRVLASSGHAVLDEGAVRIVHLAAPFSPFTENMRARVDVLEIERTWRFRNDRLTPMP